MPDPQEPPVGDGPPPARYAALDVGTNSVKFHVSERRADGTWEGLVDRVEVCRLGEGLAATGEIAPRALERTIRALAPMAEEARRLGVRGIAAVGTMGLRTARNRAEVLRRIRDETGIGIEVISGEEEGRLAYRAAQAGLGLGSGSLVVFDTGGGSSQFTFGRGPVVERRFSVDVGAVRLLEEFDLGGVVPEDRLRRAEASIAEGLSALDGAPAPETVAGIGGAVTTLAAVRHALQSYDAARVHGTRLDRAELDRQVGLYASRSTEERRRIPGLPAARADVILAGALIVRIILRKLRADALTVSDRGLRHGLLVDRFGPASG